MEFPSKLAQIEATIAAIDSQIAELEQRRKEALRSDEEYSSYLDFYAGYYDDEPLSIRQYYEFMDELTAINKEFNDTFRDGGDCEVVYQKHKSRLRFLERRLAA